MLIETDRRLEKLNVIN